MGRCHPKRIQDLGVTLVDPIRLEGDPGPGEMIGQQRRHGEAKQQLRKLGSRPMHHVAFVERIKPQQEMHDEGAVQNRRANRALPNKLMHPQPILGPGEGVVAE